MQKRILILLFSIFVYVPLLLAQANNIGQEFFLCFVNNGNLNPESNSDDKLGLTIHFYATEFTTATITCYEKPIPYKQEVKIWGNSQSTITIPYRYCYITEGGKVENKGLHIVADHPISVYASSEASASVDVSMILPTGSLGTEYMALTYTARSTQPAFAAIVATDDGTEVDITPSVLTSDSHTAGSTYKVSLDKGQTYCVMSATSNAELSGTTLKSNKPIAVFQGNSAANVPRDQTTSNDYCMEQAYPTDRWGQRFIVSSVSSQTRTILRMMSLADGIKVRVDGTWLTTLDAGKENDFVFYESRETLYIEATGPICCYQYLTCADYNDSHHGDPAMVWISPLEQLTTQARFYTFTFPNYNDNSKFTTYANLIVPTASVGDLQNNNNTFTLPFKAVSQNPDYSYVRIGLSANRFYNLSCPGGITGIVYGLNDNTAYAANIGSATDIINDGKRITKPIITNQEATICDNTTYDFYGTDISQPDVYEKTFLTELNTDSIVRLTLNVNHTGIGQLDVDICDGDVFEWGGETFDNTGIYPRYTTTTLGCDSTVIISVTKHFPHTYPSEATICQGEVYPWEGMECTEDKTYRVTYPDRFGCDSILELTLHVLDSPKEEFSMYMCHNQPVEWDGVSYDKAGDYERIYTAANGCDSTVVMHLGYYPNYSGIEFSDYVCVNPFVNTPTSYQWAGETFYAPGDYTRTLPTIYGCDSVVTLHLSFVYPVYTHRSDTITEGDTFEYDGYTFAEEGEHQIPYKSVDGCDSILVINLVLNKLVLNSATIDDHCADAPEMTVLLELRDGWYDALHYEFTPEALQAGFEDGIIELETENDTIVNIPIPEGIKAGRYEVHLTLLFNGDVVTLRPVAFNLLYPSSVIEQAWDDVMAVLTRDYNGGYDFTTFQWYRNGAPIEGATHSYLSEQLQDGDSYSVMLTDSRGVSMMSCQKEVSLTAKKIRVNPTLADRGQTITIHNTDASEAILYNSTGAEVDRFNLSDGTNTFSAPTHKGLYILQLNTTTSDRTFKIVVE